MIYGSGVHIANVIEIYSREQQGIQQGEVYDLVYFVDEGMSHYLQFVPLFFVIGWFVIHDPPGRSMYPTIALFLGVGHGVERAVGVIEGGKWFLGPPTLLWLGAAAAIRRQRLRRAGFDARDDFCFRYALSFCVTLPIAQLLYLGRYRSFAQPSGLGRVEGADDGDRGDRADAGRHVRVGGVGAVVEPAASAAGGCRAGDLTVAQEAVRPDRRGSPAPPPASR